jgi:hypothetical protein
LDSWGGNTWFADALVRLLRAPNQNDQFCQLTTVVTTVAASAAADILVGGDYAIAYPDAIIHYHGTRQSAESLTIEDAQAIVGELKRDNDRFALRMAERVVARLLFVLATIRPKTFDNNEHYRKPVDALIALLTRELRNDHTKSIIQSAYSLYQETRDLVFSTISRLRSPNDGGGTNEPDSGIETEKKIFQKILDYELDKNKEVKDWSLMRHGLDDLHNHCLQMLDYLTGNYIKYLEKLVANYGEFLLDADEVTLYKKIKSEDPAKAAEWIGKQIGGRMQVFWYFVICLCRELQKGENRLPAYEAYWLGLVDEVIGYGMPCLRVVNERSSIART